MDPAKIGTLLLVDDDKSLLTVLSDFFKYERYEVLTAETGEQALRHLASIKPALILLDISMPGMGGVQFLKELRTREGMADVPVLVFTARANMERFFENVDVAGFIAKPCEPTRLLREIKRILAVRREGEGGASAATVAVHRVLVAEDDPGLTDRIVRAFLRGGYEVETVGHGPDVLEKTIVWRPDVILLKLILPNMNGDRVAAMLQEMPSTRDIPIVLYDDSGTDQREQHYTQGDTGIRRFVKSSEPARLLEAVEQL